MGPLLTRRALGRATLARQHLLERSSRAPLDVVGHLVGMQAQIPLNPYLGLWSRIAGFRPDDLAPLLVDRAVVRIVAMRAILHLLTADDCLLLRPLMQPVLDAELRRHPEHGPALAGVDVPAVLRFAEALVAEQPRTGGELRAAMADRFPQWDAAALAYACRNLLAFVQVPPRGVWGRTGAVRSTTAEAWLGRPLEPEPSVDDVLVRYLGAFGPASVADASTWCRLTGLRAAFERLRPRLVVFRDERGRELFDVPDAPRPGEDVPAPVRFLPEYDNLLLSHDDRSRFSATGGPFTLPFGPGPGPVHGTVLVDGVVAATWWGETGPGGRQVLHVRHGPGLGRADAAAVVEEGHAFAAFEGHDDAGVRLEAAG